MHGGCTGPYSRLGNVDEEKNVRGFPIDDHPAILNRSDISERENYWRAFRLDFQLINQWSLTELWVQPFLSTDERHKVASFFMIIEGRFHVLPVRPDPEQPTDYALMPAQILDKAFRLLSAFPERTPNNLQSQARRPAQGHCSYGLDIGHTDTPSS